MARRTFFGNVRIALLLAVLAFVAANAWLDRRHSTEWDRTLRVTIYPLAASDDPGVQEFVGRLDAENYSGIAEFFSRQAADYGVTLGEPVRVRVSHAVHDAPPVLGERPGYLSVIFWSLRMRYWAWRVAVDDPLPPPDVQVFALYHPGDSPGVLPDSVGTTKGLMAIAHLFAQSGAAGSNEMVIAHELLHTLGATDKYDRATGLPLVPDGLGDAGQRPQYPQQSGEIMAGRIAVSPSRAEIPQSLDEMRVGAATAREIGWSRQ